MTLCAQCRHVISGRSDAEHDTLFGFIGVAYQNWPHQHEFQPDDAEHLRAWLLIEVTHSDQMHIPSVDLDMIRVMQQVSAFAAQNKHTRFGRTKTGCVIYKPRSLSRKTVPDRDEYQKVASAVYEVIQQITGLNVDDYTAYGKSMRPV